MSLYCRFSYLIATAVIVAVGALVVGCGDDSSGDSNTSATAATTGETERDSAGAGNAGGQGAADSATGEEAEAQVSPKARFISAARDVCAEAKARVRDKATALAQSEVTTGSKEAVYKQFFTGVIAPELEAEVEEIRALQAPAGDGPQVEAILNSIEATLRTVGEDPASVALEDGLFAKPEVMAKKYGLAGCGGP